MDAYGEFEPTLDNGVYAEPFLDKEEKPLLDEADPVLARGSFPLAAWIFILGSRETLLPFPFFPVSTSQGQAPDSALGANSGSSLFLL
jgi:hypothetical protein